MKYSIASFVSSNITKVCFQKYCINIGSPVPKEARCLEGPKVWIIHKSRWEKLGVIFFSKSDSTITSQRKKYSFVYIVKKRKNLATGHFKALFLKKIIIFNLLTFIKFKLLQYHCTFCYLSHFSSDFNTFFTNKWNFFKLSDSIDRMKQKIPNTLILADLRYIIVQKPVIICTIFNFYSPLCKIMT